MPIITAPRLRLFAPKCDAEVWTPALRSACVAWEITTPRRIAHFLGQLAHESRGFTRLEEGLSYSAKRLMEVWPSRFPNLPVARQYANNPEALAEKVYGGRMGNAEPGDGYRYRGRGLIQLTGRDNYAAFGELLGLDLIGSPGLASEPANAARIAGAFWGRRRLNTLADIDDVTGITVAINGAANGAVDRRLQVERAKGIFRMASPGL
jgi:putative chitinase